MNYEDYVHDGKLAIIVRPNARDNEITGYDEARQALKVNIKAAPEENKANMEIMKFFSRLSKKRVNIVSGHTGKKKIIAFG